MSSAEGGGLRKGILRRTIDRVWRLRDAPLPTRIIVMPGARMVATERGTWRFPHVASDKTNTDTTSGIKEEVSAGTSKMRAIEKIYKEQRRKHPQQGVVVLVTGGKERSGHSRADEAREQLTKKYGLSNDSVVSLGGVGQTIGNAQAVVDYLRAHARALKGVNSVEIVENEYKLLRAWLLFSAAILKLETGKELSVRSEDIQRVRTELFSGNRGGQDDMELHMAHTYAAMKILEPYFAKLKLRIRPIVVEEILENEQDTDAAASRREYVSRLRTHPSVIARLNQEKQGVMDFLEGKYKML